MRKRFLVLAFVLVVMLVLTSVIPAFATGDHQRRLPDLEVSACQNATGYELELENVGYPGYAAIAFFGWHGLGFMENGDVAEYETEYGGWMSLWVHSEYGGGPWVFDSWFLLSDQLPPCPVPPVPAAPDGCALDIVDVATSMLPEGVDVAYTYLGDLTVDTGAYLTTLAAETAAGTWVEPQIFGYAGQTESAGKFAIVINTCQREVGTYLAFVGPQPLVLYQVLPDEATPADVIWVVDGITFES